MRITFPRGPLWDANLGPEIIQVRDTETRALSDPEAATMVGECGHALRAGFGGGAAGVQNVGSRLGGPPGGGRWETGR